MEDNLKAGQTSRGSCPAEPLRNPDSGAGPKTGGKGRSLPRRASWTLRFRLGCIIDRMLVTRASSTSQVTADPVEKIDDLHLSTARLTRNCAGC